jgi:hypothetical protein
MNDEFDKEWEEKLMSYAQELPNEKMPSMMLEERTVRELRRRGLLRKQRTIPAAWLTGTIAASLALFATGVIVGQYMGTRSAAKVVAQVQQNQSATAAAAQVQQTGAAYVQALEALVNAARQSPNRAQDASQALEVALTALHEAASEVVHLAPNDPVVAQILQGIEQEKKQSQARNGRQPQRNIVWF